MVASLRISSPAKSLSISCFSCFESGQYRLPIGMVGLASLMRSAASVFQDAADASGHLADAGGLFDVGVLAKVGVEGHFIAVHKFFEHFGRGHAWKVGPARRRCQRKRQTDEIVGRVADDRLIEVANLNLDVSRRTSERPQITDVAIAANPDRRPVGQRSTLRPFQPFVEFLGIPTNVSMGRLRHLEITGSRENGGACVRTRECFLDFHRLSPRLNWYLRREISPSWQ
jgi:hypothetical protein